jgi:hypothetical protein
MLKGQEKGDITMVAFDRVWEALVTPKPYAELCSATEKCWLGASWRWRLVWRYRAKTQTIAHDEALEYEWFLDGGVS